MNLEDQYDRIYKYLFFHLHDQHLAEDLTQETFLRFLGSRTYQDENRQLQYLITIARNLCNQFYRDRMMEYSLDWERGLLDRETGSSLPEDFTQSMVERISLMEALQGLSVQEQEMLFLRYVNEVPVPVIGRLYHISRFAVYRRLKRILKKVMGEIEKGGEDGDGENH